MTQEFKKYLNKRNTFNLPIPNILIKTDAIGLVKSKDFLSYYELATSKTIGLLCSDNKDSEFIT